MATTLQAIQISLIGSYINGKLTMAHLEDQKMNYNLIAYIPLNSLYIYGKLTMVDLEDLKMNVYMAHTSLYIYGKLKTER